MLNSTGRELRRALFSLKQTFQDDKDLVHEFVQNDGLSCLIKVGAEADQNYQNYILRALGQVMLYVDGMNGVIAHNDTIQWLYSLLASPFRLVVKTALKLLLVFVEYTESNSLLLLAAVYIVDKDRGALPWSKLMQILNDKDNIDIELFIYTMTLINKTLNAIPDQDTFYDVCDSLDQQKMDSVLKRLTTTMANKDLTEQCRIYENLIKDEDGDENFNSLKRPTTRKRMSSDEGRTGRRQMVADLMSPGGTTDFRRSSYSTQYSTPVKRAQSQNNNNNNNNSIRNINNNSSSSGVMEISRNESLAKPRRVEEMVQKTETKDTLQISREKVDEPVLELNNNKIQFAKTSNQTTSPGSPLNKFRALEQTTSSPSANKSNLSSPDHSLPGSPVVTRSIRAQYSNGGGTNDVNTKIFPPKSLDLHSVHQPVAENGSTDNFAPIANGHATMSPPAPRTGTPVANGVGYHGNHKHSLGAVHSLAEKFQTQNHATPKHSSIDQTSANGQQTGEEDGQNQDGTFAAALSIARKCKKIDARDPLDTRKESEIQWEKAIATLSRPLVINDLDFTELDDYDDCDPLRANFNKSVNGGPPPPPPLGAAPPLPPGGFMMNGSGYHTMHSPRPPSPPRPDSPNAANQQQQQAKDMKTVKLFWKEAQTQAPPGVLDKTGGVVFWQKVKPVQIDSNKLICLFETKSNKDMSSKKKEDKKTEIRVLDTKRSNAINIGLTKLPPPRAINAAILKFDSSVMNKECIEKILCTMMPTEEEKEKILDSKAANPDIPLGSAEQFLILLSEIPALFPRLKLWLFMLDYANLEREVAEPLMDLKVALHELENCRTFQYVLATLLSIGNVLNGIEIKGFQLDFLAKVPEVKDTVNKHSLVYHLCNIVMEKFPDSTDLYSELGAVIRCAKVDFDEVRSTLDKTETDCKHSWDHLRDLIKHEPSNQSKNKISEFLMDSAQRILTLKVIHTRVMNRFRKFLIYMGSPAGLVRESKVNNICKTVAEFSLEYRTCRDKIVQQRKRIQDKRERNKTRGKLIIETRQWSSSSSNGNAANGTNGHHHLHGGDVVSNGSNVDQKRHCELSKLLKAKTLDDAGCNSYPGARLRTRKSTDDLTSGTSSYPSRYSGPPALESHDVGDDEILDGLVKAATIHTDHMRERRRARHFNRKSLRRTRTVKLDEDEQPGPVS